MGVPWQKQTKDQNKGVLLMKRPFRKSKRVADLPADYALVLQQIDEDGGEDFNNLVETLGVERPRLAHILSSLQNKGLVLMRTTANGEFWIELSRKGQRLMRYLWPESSSGYAAVRA